MNISLDNNADSDPVIEAAVVSFLSTVPTLEQTIDTDLTIHRDGQSGSYYVRCGISAEQASILVDFNALLDPDNTESYRANRELLLSNNTFKRMSQDARNGREFSDIIVEYHTGYDSGTPLKVWGGQHRSRSIPAAASSHPTRFHGFRVYFNLSKHQRSDLALISNTNINVSNDLFDRQLEEAHVGGFLRTWAAKAGLLAEGEDFPDARAKSERITVQLARSFVVNYFAGKEKGQSLSEAELDKNIYEPSLCVSGLVLDPDYTDLLAVHGPSPWEDNGLNSAAAASAKLHKAQSAAITKSKANRKGFRTKALTLSVLPAWTYVAGLLSPFEQRLIRHFAVPHAPKGVSDPLSAEEMSKYRHDKDAPTYRGLGTRSSQTDRQRMAQVFLARTVADSLVFDKKLINQAVSQVIGLKVLMGGYLT
jgi:hypothetical protein